MGTILGEIVDFVLVIIRLAIWLEFIFLDFFVGISSLCLVVEKLAGEENE